MSKRDDYQESMEQHLGQWRVRLEAMRSKAASSTSVELHEQLEAWRAGGKRALAKLGELKAASSDSWDGIRIELERLWHGIETMLVTDPPATPPSWHEKRIAGGQEEGSGKPIPAQPKAGDMPPVPPPATEGS